MSNKDYRFLILGFKGFTELLKSLISIPCLSGFLPIGMAGRLVIKSRKDDFKDRH